MKSLYFIFLMLILPLQALFAQNHPPVAVNDTVEAYGQMPVIIDVLANDYDVDGDSIILSEIRTHGDDTAFIENQKINFTPSYKQGYHLIRYVIADEHNDEDWTLAWVNILIHPDAPVAVADTFELVALKSYNLNLLANDFDPNGNAFKIKNISAYSNCHLTISPDSLSVILTPDNEAQYGNFSYHLKETDGAGYESQDVKVIFKILINNDVPDIKPDSATVIGGIPVYIPVLENDIDPQGDILELNILGDSQNGSLSKSGDSILYTPDLSFSGVESFYYSIREKLDTTIYSPFTTVTVNVSKNPHCPVAVADEVSGTAGVPITIDVLANDYDPDGDLYELMTVSGGTITADNKILLVSTSYQSGYREIRYRIKEINNDLSFSDWTTVSVNLAQNPNYPEAVADYATTRAGIPVKILPLKNDNLLSYDSVFLENIYIVDKKKMGEIRTKGDTIIYYPFFQAEGIQKIGYNLSTRNPHQFLSNGFVYVTIDKQQFTDSLQVNAINAGVSACGKLFYDMTEIPGDIQYGLNIPINPHFKYPANSQKSTILSNSLWLGGYDSNDSIHLSYDLYGEPHSQWQAGPVSNKYDSAYSLKYSRVWRINKDEIEYHKQHYSNEEYAPVDAILNWPGNGNPSLGQSLQLAPYFDKNSDGFYNCMDGDYPLIRGDQTIFIMYNDDLQHFPPTSSGLKAEIHAMIYGYNAPQDTALFNTVFVHYDVINRSDEVYSECLLGTLTDYDLGDYADDQLRCDVNRGSYYVYNGKQIDKIYGENPPAMSVTVLAGPFMDADGVDDPAGGCDESVNGINFGNLIADDERSGLSRFNNFVQYVQQPYLWPDYHMPEQIYGCMNGYWDDFTNILYGGTGHQSPGSVGPSCRFMFPGESDPLNWGTDCQFPNGGYNQGTKFWTEEQSWIPYGDKRGLGSLGPFTFSPGQVQEIDLAYVIGQGDNGPSSSVDQLLRNIDSLRRKVSLGEVVIPNSSLGSKDVTELQTVTVYPNPTKDIFLVSGLNSKEGEYTITNLYGKALMQGRLLGSTRQEINVAKLPAGIYFIRINSGSSVSSGKFIKIN